MRGGGPGRGGGLDRWEGVVEEAGAEGRGRRRGGEVWGGCKGCVSYGGVRGWGRSGSGVCGLAHATGVGVYRDDSGGWRRRMWLWVQVLREAAGVRGVGGDGRGWMQGRGERVVGLCRGVWVGA